MVTGGLEAAGDAITGAVLGRAVEPTHGEGHGDGAGNCLNCGTALIGKHCHECGQTAHVHRTLEAYWHDLLHGVFHFEGKIWQTLPLLIWKPGELTRRYVHGERAKFVSPLALFLFAVFLMFGIVTGLAGEMHAPSISAKDAGKSVQQIDAELKIQNTKKVDLTRKMAALPAGDPARDVLHRQLNSVEKDIEGLKTVHGFLRGNTGSDADLAKIDTGWVSLDRALKKANENPDLLLYKLQSSAYKYSWALIPLSTPFVWLLFCWRRQFKLYDHAIFVTYSLTFMMFLVIVLTILGFVGVGEPVVPIAGVFLPPIHMYRQLRGAYGVSRFGAIVRTAALTIFGAVVLTLFVAFLFALGVLA